MKNDYDFQVGDKVYDLMFGNGSIVDVDMELHTAIDAIEVRFNNAIDGVGFLYSFSGCLYLISGGNYDFITTEEIHTIQRTLFHGHNIMKKVNTGDGPFMIKEKKPTRTIWVNAYINEENKPYFGKNTFTTKEKALEFKYKNSTYVTTIELKPYVGVTNEKN